MARSLKVVFYAVNGSGVGHLTRLVAIARWVRRYAAHAGARAEIWFLTSSEATDLLFREHFAAFKLPSKTAVGDAGIDKLAYLALAKQWVWHSLGLLRPDLFVVDTFPRGSFGELLSALDLCQRRAFVYRPTKASFAARPDFQAMLPLYDAILVPDHEERGAVVVPEAARDKLRHLGPILLRDACELASREAARAALGLAPDQKAIYVSTGGGGDERAEARIRSTVDALRAIPRARFVVGAGPLYRGRRIDADDVRWLGHSGAQELMAAFDVAVSAAGYNTFHELMNAGVPSVFLPLDKVADDQALRARTAEEAGAAIALSDASDADALRAAVRRLLEPEAHANASHAARALVPRSHARDAAAELLRLVLSPSAVDAAEDAIGDGVLRAAVDLEMGEAPLVELMHALSPPNDGASPRAAEASELALALVRAAASSGAPPLAAARVATGFVRRLPLATPAERARAAEALLVALAPFDDWPGALTLVKQLGTERRMGAAELSSELGALLADVRAAGGDLYRAVAQLAAAQGTADAPPNAVTLRAARAALGATGPESATYEAEDA